MADEMNPMDPAVTPADDQAAPMDAPMPETPAEPTDTPMPGSPAGEPAEGEAEGAM